MIKHATKLCWPNEFAIIKGLEEYAIIENGRRDMSHEFLKSCISKPKTLADLKVGDKFIFFPDDGDDSGHGGFQGGSNLMEKIEPYHPKDDRHKYADDYLITCKYADTNCELSWPLKSLVIPIHVREDMIEKTLQQIKDKSPKMTLEEACRKFCDEYMHDGNHQGIAHNGENIVVYSKKKGNYPKTYESYNVEEVVVGQMRAEPYRPKKS